MDEKILIGFHCKEDLKGYYGVQFYDDDGNCKNHWLSGSQVKYFLNRRDAVKYIKEVRGWNAISFTQTLIYKIK